MAARLIGSGGATRIAAMTRHWSSPPIGSPDVLFRAEGLHKSFGGVRAVRDISFDIPAGAVFAIIGPNGAGKSTLLNLMSGVYQPDAGSLDFDGTDLTGMPAHRRVRLGIARTFQKIRLFKQLSVLDNVVAGFHIHHDIPAWQYLIHGAGVPARPRALPRGGDGAARLRRARRRGAMCSPARCPMASSACSKFARALATKPRLLLVDEPAAGLNASEVDSLLDRILTTARQAASPWSWSSTTWIW